MVGTFGDGVGRRGWKKGLEKGWLSEEVQLLVQEPVDGVEGRLAHTGVGQAGFCCSGGSRGRDPAGAHTVCGWRKAR